MVAGCIGDVEQWKHFEREWKAALAPLGTQIFHTVDFDAGKPPFDKLTAQEADDLFARLAEIICRRIEKSVSQAIPLDQYKIVNAKYIFADMYGFPYPAAARYCLGLVAEWAAKHSIPSDEILRFFENGAKHKGQIEWFAARDGFRFPFFGEKSELMPLQCADLIAWCNHLYLNVGGGKVPKRYDSALTTLARKSSQWGVMNLQDPDRLPSIFGIPRRDPSFNYKYRIIRAKGQRRAVVEYSPKAGNKQSKLVRKTLDLPDLTTLSVEDVTTAITAYEASRVEKPEST